MLVFILKKTSFSPSVCVWFCGLMMATRCRCKGGDFLPSLFRLPDVGGESTGGSWKWLCHMGNYSTLRSERTHKRPHYLLKHCWPACEETQSWCVQSICWKYRLLDAALSQNTTRHKFTLWKFTDKQFLSITRTML